MALEFGFVTQSGQVGVIVMMDDAVIPRHDVGKMLA